MKEVLKFSATWCAPCKILSKTIESAGDLGIKITEIDIDEQIALSAKYDIRSVPTMIMLDDDGYQLKRKSGVMNLQQLKEFLV